MEATEEGGHYAEEIGGAWPVRQLLLLRRQPTLVEPEDERLPLRFPREDLRGLRQELPSNTVPRRVEGR